MSTAIAIGNFDAVHLGHAALVEVAREHVGSGGRVVMWSFDPSPVSVLKPDVHIERVTTFSQRCTLLMDAGADEVRRIEPTPELLALEPEDYIARITAEVSPTFFVEGAGFRFGHKRGGTIQTLCTLGEKYHFEVLEVPPVSVVLEGKEVKASSSMVRQLLNEGRMQDVSCMLGRPYELSGTVIQGDGRGRTLGIPTANLGTIETMLPREGIYAGTATVDDVPYIAAVSVGTKPTFGEHELICEVHLIGFDGEIGLYDWPLTVTISHWIREQITFESIEELTIAIQQDIQVAIKNIESNT